MIRNWGVFEDYQGLVDNLTLQFLSTQCETVDVGQWQSTDISDRPEMITKELPHTSLVFRWGLKDEDVEGLQSKIPANQPWAETHFQERVSGIPWNPPPSNEIWPYAQADNEQWKQGGKFSHTYPERFWPRHAGGPFDEGEVQTPLSGIRYHVGDLHDVTDLLEKYPLTRQAFLPVWFPEDTGVVHGERVPCTLGYHFMIRKGYLTVTYYMRSCDFLRHFADDLYMAARLAQWVSHSIRDVLWDRHEMRVQANAVIMHIASLHIFMGDWEIMKNNQLKKLNLVSNYSAGPDVANIMKGLG